MIRIISSQRKRYLEYMDEKEKRKLPRNISLVNNRYVVTKFVNGKHKYFKGFGKLSEAVDYRNRLIDNNWEPLPLSEEELYEKNLQEYYTGIVLSKNHRRYIVNNYAGDYLGACNTIEEALQFRDMYYHTTFEETPRPRTIDLKHNNLHLIHGLEYPLPERLTPTKKSNYGKGRIRKKGKNSYHIYYGGSNNGQKSYYCACRTYEQAWYVHRELQKCGWNRDKLQEILDNYPVFYTELMELYKYVNLDYETKKRTGQIKYWITIPRAYLEEGKQLETITGYNHVEDALYERDWLMEHDWNYDELVEAIDDRENPYYDMELPPYPERKIRNLVDRDYHEKELTEIFHLIYDDGIVNQEEICERIGINSSVTLRNWLKNFWNTTWTEFKRVSLTGENPLNTLEKKEIIYQPDLSRPMPSNFKGWVQKNSSSKRSPYQVRKGNIEYGYYPTEKMARQVVKKLIACDWDKSKLPEIKKSVGFVPRPKRGNIYPNTNSRSWSVRHKEPGTRKMINYGSYKDYDLAVIVRDMLVLNDWNKEEYPSIRSLAEEVLNIRRLLENNMFHGEYDNNLLEYLCAIEDVYTDERKYIYSYGRNYIVQKSVNGCVERFGVYNTREDAVTARNLLIDNNWDREVLELVKELKL